MTNDLNEASKIKIRRDITENWESLNPILDEGEIGIEWIDLNQGICYIKVGNNIDHWNQLPYFSGKDISYSNIIDSTLPTINGKTLSGNLSLEELGIQPVGNYAYTTYVNAQLDSKANSADVYPKQYIDAKFNEYSESLVPSIDGNEGKYLKVVSINDNPVMMWSEISNDYVTTDVFEETLQNYVEKEEGYSLVNEEQYNDIINDVESLKETVGDDSDGLVQDVELLKTEVDEKVGKTELKKILTGDDSGETPYSASGYASKDDLADKASIEQLNLKADNDIVQAHIYNAINPHHITKETIGLSHVDDTADLDKPISNATQTALDNKMYNYTIGTGLGVKTGSNNELELYNKIQQTNWNTLNTGDTSCILNKPTNEEFQADWDETNSSKLGYIKNKPEINEYELPVATSSELGGIKLGEGFSVDEEGHLAYQEKGDYNDLDNKPSFLAPKRYPLVNKGTVSKVSNLPSTGQNIGDYYHVTNINMDYAWDVDLKWIVLTDYDRTIGYISDPREMVEYPFIGQMSASDLNLASLTVAKSIDDRLEATKVDKVTEPRKIYGTDEYGDQTTYAFDNVEEVSEAIEQLGDLTLIAKYNSSENSGTPVEDYVSENLYGYGKVYNYDGIKSDYVYSIDDTCNKNYIETNFARHDNRISILQQCKEENMYKTNTIDGLSNEQYQIYYPTAGAVKTKTDEIITDYNAKITAEKNRAIARENSIENDLHTNYYTKPEVDIKVSSVFRYKGTVQTYSQLPINGNIEGDVWNVIEEDVSHGIKAGDNVAWVAATQGEEAHWDVLAGITNLSNYYTKSEVDTNFATKGQFEDEFDEVNDEIEQLTDYTIAQLATKADIANSLEGYGITDAYTKVDTEVLINNAVSDKALQVEVDAITAPAIYRGTVEYYNELPSENLNVNDLYVVSSTREYYVWDGSVWIKQVPLGDKADKLTTYTKSEIDNNFATITLVNTKASTLSLTSHTSNTANPHSVTKAQVGLGNVDNTSDLNKPISNATQLALNGKQDSLSNAQLAAVNSGVTSAKVSSYDTAVATIPTLATNADLALVRQTANNAAATVVTKADANNVYTKAEIDGKISGGMHFKGTVANVSDLPAQNNQLGDMYNVTSTGANYAWDGHVWDKLSEVIDLSVYYTKTEIDSKVSDINDDIDNLETNLQTQINGKQATLTAGANVTIENNVISADVEGTLSTKLSELQNDVGFITLSQVPAINNGILTIQKNGADIDTFTANSSTDKSINITVPTKVTDLSDANNYAKTSSLATVATSGSYNDLSNKPTIGNAVLSIQKNGTTVDSFTANATSNKTINITVPTTVAELSDSSNYQSTLVSGTNIKTVNNQSLLGNGNINIDSLPSQTGNNGKFLTTDGSAASWATVTMPTVDQTYVYNSSSTNALSHKAIVNAKFLRNYAVNTSTSLRICNEHVSVTDETGTSSIAIGGLLTTAKGKYSVSLGQGASSNNDYGISLGYIASSMAKSAIQIGRGINVDAATMKIGFILADDSIVNYKLLDGTTGLIPDDRISTNIARTSNIPTVDQTYDGTSANAQSGVAIQTKLSSDYYTKAEVDAMLGNIEAILQRLNSGNNS